MTSNGSKTAVVIIQARMTSERLPGKVLADIAGEPMLGHVVRRARRITGIDRCLVATSSDAADDPIVEFCRRSGIDVFRGHPTDVLDRYYRAAQSNGADIVIRVTGDCPLLDPSVSGQVLQAFLSADPPLDFIANRLPWQRSYPIGLDTEVCSFSALARAWDEATKPGDREHVMPYLYAEGNDFRWQLLEAENDYSQHRWTVDTRADLSFVRAVFEAMAPNQLFGWRELLALLEARPELSEMNAHVQHRQIPDTDPRFTPANDQGG